MGDRSGFLAFRVSEDDNRTIREAAAAAGVSISEFLRAAALAAAEALERIESTRGKDR